MRSGSHEPLSLSTAVPCVICCRYVTAVKLETESSEYTWREDESKYAMSTIHSMAQHVERFQVGVWSVWSSHRRIQISCWKLWSNIMDLFMYITNKAVKYV